MSYLKDYSKIKWVFKSKNKIKAKLIIKQDIHRHNFTDYKFSY